MPEKSIRTELYDRLAEILAMTTQEKVALVAFRAMRALNPRGRLFIVSPLLVEERDSRIKLSDAVAEQIYKELDQGLPYSRVASNLRVSARRVRKLQAVWAGLPEWLKDQHRVEWARERRRQADTLEVGRDVGNRRALLRGGPGST